MGYHKRSIAILPLLLVVALKAQYGPLDVTLARATSLLAPHTSVLIDATGHLVFVQRDSYDVVRKDRIPLDALEVGSITLDASGTMLLTCPTDRARCTHSVIFRTDQEVRSSELRIQAPADSIQANAALLAVRALAAHVADIAQEH